MNEGLQQTSMDIIMHAGNARNICMDALDAMASFDIAKSEELIASAKEELLIAHRAHTDVLQKVISEEQDEEYSILFTHAQDTMMVCSSEINIAEKLLCVCKACDQRISSLEKR